MDEQDLTQSANASPEDPAPRAGEGPTTTRRRFLLGVGKKAIYATPILLTLAASEARAGSASCKPAGSPCTTAAECCSNFCIPGPMRCS